MAIFAPPTNGSAVQVVSAGFGAVATGTTVIPLDDTIPQNTEGIEFMTLAITPKSTTNLLVIEVVACLSNTVANDLTVALFQDSTANALAATNGYMATATAMATIPLIHTMTAGTTSSTTFRVRCGGRSAGTTTFNGTAGTRIFNTIPKSYIKITEYKA